MPEAKSQYGFSGRLTAEFPSQLIVDATELCNLACIHCAHPEFKKSEYYSGKQLDPQLNIKAVDEVAAHGQGKCQYIRYTGEGEPLIHPHIFDMVRYAVENSGVTVTITTNGTLGGKKLQQLIDTGIDIIDISIDAFTPDTYAEIRVNGVLEETVANVKQLISLAANTKTKVVVSYIEQPQNVGETDDFRAFWEDAGADYVVVRRMHSNAGALVQLADDMREQNSARRPCLYPWERIVLNPRGFLSFCPADWTHGSTLVNYHETTIRETWQGPLYEALRQAHLSNNFQNHQFCGQCPDWVSTRWPDEGRSYADMVQDFKERE